MCALNRELLKNPDEQTAKQRVLNQFGDPIKIARQLWLDAMKEKIMSQRIMTGVSVVMAVCGFIVVGLVWSMMDESQAVNARIVKQLEEIATRPQPVVQNDLISEDMNQVSFQLVQGDIGGKPVIGFNGNLTKTGNKTDSFTLKEVSNKKGKLEFGKLPWGGYSLTLESSWGEYYDTDLTVLPGRNYSQTIVCPVLAPVEVPVRFQVQWPDQLKSDDLLLLCDFRPRPYSEGVSGLSRKIGAENWTRSFPNPLDGKWDYPMACLINQKNQVIRCPLDQNRRFKKIDFGKLEAKNSVKMIEGDQYLLPVMYLLNKQDLAELSQLEFGESGSQVAYGVLNHSRKSLSMFFPDRISLESDGFGSPVGFNPTTMIVTARKIAALSATEGKGDSNSFANGIQFSKLLEFTAAKDHDNVWEIKLPELKLLKVPEGTKQVEVKGSGGGLF